MHMCQLSEKSETQHKNILVLELSKFRSAHYDHIKMSASHSNGLDKSVLKMDKISSCLAVFFILCYILQQANWFKPKKTKQTNKNYWCI